MARERLDRVFFCPACGGILAWKDLICSCGTVVDRSLAPVVKGGIPWGGDPEGEFDTTYRNMIHVAQDWPPWAAYEVTADVAVAGISITKRQKAAREFTRGSHQRLELVPEPDNRHDPNAIAVVAYWNDRGSGAARSAQVGYVPADTAGWITARYPGVPLAARLAIIFAAIDEKDVGLRFDIGCAARRG